MILDIRSYYMYIIFSICILYDMQLNSKLTKEFGSYSAWFNPIIPTKARRYCHCTIIPTVSRIIVIPQSINGVCPWSSISPRPNAGVFFSSNPNPFCPFFFNIIYNLQNKVHCSLISNRGQISTILLTFSSGIIPIPCCQRPFNITLSCFWKVKPSFIRTTLLILSVIGDLSLML